MKKTAEKTTEPRKTPKSPKPPPETAAVAAVSSPPAKPNCAIRARQRVAASRKAAINKAIFQPSE
jgi:hypothetical protein